MTSRWTTSLDSIDLLLTAKSLTLLGRGSPNPADPTTSAHPGPATPTFTQPTKQDEETIAGSSDNIVDNLKQREVSRRRSRIWNKNAYNLHPVDKGPSTTAVTQCDKIVMEADSRSQSGLIQSVEIPSNPPSPEVDLLSKQETPFNYPEVLALHNSGRQLKADISGTENVVVESGAVLGDQGLASHRVKRTQRLRVSSDGVQRVPMSVFIDEKRAYDAYARRKPRSRRGNATVEHS